MAPPAVSDHLRPTDADLPDGVYRVVGTDDDAVTLLRVGDADGRRVHTGDLHRVDRADLDGLDPADPPGERSIGVGSALSSTYWSLRTFLEQLAAHPLPAAVALALVLFGWIGDELLRLPSVAFGVAILVGSVGLAYVGGGRL